MGSNWYLGRDGQKIGPFTAHQIQQLASLGMVKSEDHLLAEGAARWVAAASLAWIGFDKGGERYFLSLFGSTYGPYTAQQIRGALLSGKIAPTTPACPQDNKQWRPLREMSEFCHSVPTTVKESEAPSSVDKATMSRSEAELYLAGKQGDSIAKLVFVLQQMRKRYGENPSMEQIISKNIADLLAIRESGARLLDSSKPAPAPGANR
jgi:hypothetical protein